MFRTFLILFVVVSGVIAGLAGYSTATQFLPPPLYVIGVLVFIVFITARLYVGDADGINAFFRFLALATAILSLAGVTAWSLLIVPNQIPPGRVTVDADLIALRIGLEEGAFPDGFANETVDSLTIRVAGTILEYPNREVCSKGIAETIKYEGHQPADEMAFLRDLNAKYQRCKNAGIAYQENLQLTRYKWTDWTIAVLAVLVTSAALLALIISLSGRLAPWAPYIAVTVIHLAALGVMAGIVAPTNHAANVLVEVFVSGAFISLLEIIIALLVIFVAWNTKKMGRAEAPKLSFRDRILFTFLGAIIGLPWVAYLLYRNAILAVEANHDVPLALAITCSIVGFTLAMGWIGNVFKFLIQSSNGAKASD